VTNESQNVAERIVVLGFAISAVSCATVSRQKWIKEGAATGDQVLPIPASRRYGATLTDAATCSIGS